MAVPLTMSSTALRNLARPVLSLCSATRCAKNWQLKSLATMGSVVTRWPSHITVDSVFVNFSSPLSSADSVIKSRRRSGLGPKATTFSARHVFAAATTGSFLGEETSADAGVIQENSDEEFADSAPVVEQQPSPAVEERTESFEPPVPGRPRRRDPTVPEEALVRGAVFQGTVVGIQSYGAFVDFGAFTNGLVHISYLSQGFVRRVTDVVSMGQEVTVSVLSVDRAAGRISLSMAGTPEVEPLNLRS